ncbi:MAG: CDGSH iron-sulfur domain-containing protein [Nannocystaceae bacterium]
MTEAIVAATHPAKVELESGKDYYWCACDRSASQPFCDGSHRGSEFTPLKLAAKWPCKNKSIDEVRGTCLEAFGVHSGGIRTLCYFCAAPKKLGSGKF